MVNIKSSSKSDRQKNVKVAVVGAGAMGKQHARNYRGIPGIDLVAIADINTAVGQKVADTYRTKFYNDYKILLKLEQPDAVSIVVPTKFHKTVALDFINAGISVLIEKPLAPTVKEAEEIVLAAKNKKVILEAGHIERFNPVITKLQDLIKSGELGDILSIVIKRVGLFPPRVKDVNVVTDISVHDLDIVTTLLNRLPISIYAAGGNGISQEREDHAEIFLNYGTFGCFIQSNWVTPIKVRTLSITGTKGYAELDYITQKLDLYKTNYRITQPKGFKDFISDYGIPEKVDIDLKTAEPLKLELMNFINAVRKTGEILVSGEDGITAVMLAEKVIKSIKRNLLIRLP